MIALAPSVARAQYAGAQFSEGRLTVIAEARDAVLARSLLTAAVARDTFSGLPRPRQTVLIVIAADRRRFREYAGDVTPEWGSAFAFPAERRIVMQGSSAGADAGDPHVVLRHELAHLVLHEFLGDLPPRWFDEGYASFAANEWGRDQALATNIALALKGMPVLDSLDAGFAAGATRASATYALAYRAVADLAALDRVHGLSLLFAYWPRSGGLDQAIRAAFGITLADFEKRWRSQTRRRYGGLAVFADITVATLLLLFVITPLYLIRRQRDKLRLEAMRAREAQQEQREREAIVDALLRGLPPPTDSPEGRNGPI